MTKRTTLSNILTTTKIDKKGQFTVPKQFRKDLGLDDGAPFAVLRLGDGLILLPEQQRFDRLCQKISLTLTAAGLIPNDLLSTLPEARNRVYAQHYKKSRTHSSLGRRLRSQRGK